MSGHACGYTNVRGSIPVVLFDLGDEFVLIAWVTLSGIMSQRDPQISEAELHLIIQLLQPVSCDPSLHWCPCIEKKGSNIMHDSGEKSVVHKEHNHESFTIPSRPFPQYLSKQHWGYGSSLGHHRSGLGTTCLSVIQSIYPIHCWLIRGKDALPPGSLLTP